MNFLHAHKNLIKLRFGTALKLDLQGGQKKSVRKPKLNHNLKFF